MSQTNLIPSASLGANRKKQRLWDQGNRHLEHAHWIFEKPYFRLDLLPEILWLPVLLVVYHLPLKPENLDRMYMGKINFVSPNGYFLKFPKGKCAFINSFLLVPGSLYNFLTSGKKSWKLNKRISVEISIRNLTRPNYYNCQPTGFSE